MSMNLEPMNEKDKPETRSEEIRQNMLYQHIKAGQKLPPNELISCTMVITPELAEHILKEYNPRNRPITESRVKEYADAMKEGRWAFTSQGISFNRKGFLNNGQHRLLAIARSRQSVRMYLTFGEDVKAFHVLDTARARTGSDVLSITGHKNTHVLAAAIRLIHAVKSGTLSGPAFLSNDEIVALVEVYGKDKLAEAVVIGSRIAGGFKTSGSAISAALYLIKQGSRHRDQLAFDKFVQSFEKGTGLNREDHPILKLRAGLHTKKFGAGVINNAARGVVIIACIIKAWNYFIKGRGLKILTWSPSENFPKVL